MGLWSDWRVGRERHRRALRYLAQLTQPVDQQLLKRFVGVGISSDMAGRELAFAWRAIGLIVADRDALDDRTASDIAHILAPVIAVESRRDEGLGREWNARWRAYTAALAARGTPDSPPVRLAKVLLDGAGTTEPSGEQLQVSTEIIQQMRVTLNEALRSAFGAASLPENVKPSAMQAVGRKGELLGER